MSFSRLFRDPFQGHFHFLLLRLRPFHSRFLNSLHELLPAFGREHVFDPDVDPFGDDAGADPLVHHDSDGMRRDIVHSSGASVVELVRHALLESAVAFDVDQVAPFVDPQVRRQMLHSAAPECPREQVPRSPPVSFRVGHDAGGRS